MAGENHTMNNEFNLTGLTDHPEEMKSFLYGVFFFFHLSDHNGKES